MYNFLFVSLANRINYLRANVAREIASAHSQGYTTHDAIFAEINDLIRSSEGYLNRGMDEKLYKALDMLNSIATSIYSVAHSKALRDLEDALCIYQDAQGKVDMPLTGDLSRVYDAMLSQPLQAIEQLTRVYDKLVQ